MEKYNYWENQLFIFDRNLPLPKNSMEWKSIGDWKSFWKDSWKHNSETITNKKSKLPLEYLNKIEYKFTKKSFDKFHFKNLCLSEISNKSFPTFLALVVLFKEFNVLSNIRKNIIDELDIFDLHSLSLSNNFKKEKPQIHQTITYLTMKITKMLNNKYSFEELQLDNKQLKETINLVNTSVKMAINDLSIHKYNMNIKDTRLIDFEYDILIQFINMLSNAFVVGIINNNDNIKSIINEIGIFEHKMEVISESLNHIEEDWLREKTIESLTLFIEVCNSLKNFTGNDKIIVEKVSKLPQNKINETNQSRSINNSFEKKSN